MEKKKSKLKKNIKMFLNSEEGKMLGADIVKTGIALGILGTVVDAQAQTWELIHNNYFDRYTHVSHASHGSHSSHGSHGSHARGGWCW